MAALTLTGFGPQDVDAVHEASAAVLSRTGVKVESEEAAAIFHGGGADIEKQKNGFTVRIPRPLLEDCISWAPDAFVMYGRDPAADFVVGPGSCCFTLFGENVKVNDLYTGRQRPCTKADLGQATRVADALDPIGVIEKCMGAHDKPADTQSLHNYETMVTNTGKHVLHGFFSARNAHRIVDMASICVGGREAFLKRPCVTSVVCPTSPLMLVKQCCDVIVACAGLGVGLCAVSMPLCGTTAPATMAGTLAVQNAELLSALVLAQLKRRHTPFIYGSVATVTDLKSGSPAMGAPECGVFSLASAQMARHYKIPSWCGTGNSGSKTPNAQSGYEYALNVFPAVAAGCNIVFGCGGIENGLTFDYAKMIMDVEHARNVLQLVKGMDLSDAAFALDLIHAVGPGGEYLTSGHTLAHMRAMSRGDMFDRLQRQVWLDQLGGKDVVERAYEKAREILETHAPPPLPDGVAEEMRAIVEACEASDRH